MQRRFALTLVSIGLVGGLVACDGPDANPDAAALDASAVDSGPRSDGAPPSDAATDPDAGSASPGSLRARVTTSAGDAIEGATVSVGATSAITDASGFATLADLPSGSSLVVIARSPGQVDVHSLITLEPGLESTLALDVPPSESVRTSLGAGTTTVEVAGMEVTLPPDGSFRTLAGTPYSGPVEVRVASRTSSSRSIARARP